MDFGHDFPGEGQGNADTGGGNTRQHFNNIIESRRFHNNQLLLRILLTQRQLTNL